MQVTGIQNFGSLGRIYPVSTYKNYQKIPAVEKIQPDLENSSRQIQKLDLFRYYGQKGTFSEYSKGIYIDLLL